MATLAEIGAAAQADLEFGAIFKQLAHLLHDVHFPGIVWEKVEPGASEQAFTFIKIPIRFGYGVRTLNEQFIGVFLATRQKSGWQNWDEPTLIFTMDKLGNVYLDEHYVGGITFTDPADLEKIWIRIVSPYMPRKYDPSEGKKK